MPFPGELLPKVLQKDSCKRNITKFVAWDLILFNLNQCSIVYLENKMQCFHS